MLAWAAWRMAGKVLDKARKIFLSLGPTEIPSHLREFIKQWGPQIEEQKHASNRPGRGSKTHVDPGLVKLAVHRFAKGYITEGGQTRYYPTFFYAVAYDPVIRAAVERSGVTAATFFAHMRVVSPVLLPRQCSAE